MSSVSQNSLTYLGMDVHKDSISVGILRPDDSMDVEKLFHDDESVRRFIARMGDPRRLTACYEAGPTGYGLHRQLEHLGVRCRVEAPSLIPKAPGGPGQDRPQGLPAAGTPGPGRRPGGHPGSQPRGGGCAGSVPGPGGDLSLHHSAQELLG
ncbi:MAG: hypothetical protein NVSMB32_07740 [Actinomycetota bacterium]